MMTVAHERANLTADARRYIDEASSALDGLEIGQREELLSDVVDAIAELDGPVSYDGLIERLGAPNEFARELRDSAGLPPAPEADAAGAAALPAGPPLLERAVARMTGWFEWSGRELEPLWWVVRALAVAFVLAWFGFARGGLVMTTLVLIGVSIFVGLRVRERRDGLGADRDVRWRGVGLIGCGAIVVWALAAALTGGSDVEYIYEGPGSTHSYGLMTPTGDEITNIYAFNAAGERIHDVRLYTQDGKPLDIGGADQEGTLPSGECCFATDDEYANAGEQRFRVFDTARREQFNAFPIRYAEIDSGEIANPDAGWPTNPKPLIIAPSIEVKDAKDEIEAEVERRVQEELKQREGKAKAESAPRAKQQAKRKQG